MKTRDNLNLKKGFHLKFDLVVAKLPSTGCSNELHEQLGLLPVHLSHPNSNNFNLAKISRYKTC